MTPALLYGRRPYPNLALVEVLDRSGKRVAWRDTDGAIVSSLGCGQVGSVKGRQVYDLYNLVGYLDNKGLVFDHRGLSVGSVCPAGRARNCRGLVEYCTRPADRRAAAAALLLLA